MNTKRYNVHIYREMRLVFETIEAESPQAAAAIARDKPTDEAALIDDCEGTTLSALVDEIGDEEYERSVFIDFEEERRRKAAPTLLAAVEAFLEADELAVQCSEWKWENLAQAFQLARSAVAEAAAAGISPQGPEHAAGFHPIVTVSVRGGLIEDLDATIPVTVVIEDWDVTDEETGQRPARSVHALTGGLSGPGLTKLRRLTAQD